MARLGVLYALTKEELGKLREQPEAERYEYMLEEIEEALLETPRGCELDKAWEGIQYCLGGGRWVEDNCIPCNIIFGGEFLVETDEEIITVKDPAAVKSIVDYLRQNSLQSIIKNNFERIDGEEYTLPKDDNGLNYLLGWSEDVLAFYENALRENCYVIFSVDL